MVVSRELAGTNPKTGRRSYFFNLKCLNKFHRCCPLACGRDYVTLPFPEHTVGGIVLYSSHLSVDVPSVVPGEATGTMQLPVNVPGVAIEAIGRDHALFVEPRIQVLADRDGKKFASIQKADETDKEEHVKKFFSQQCKLLRTSTN